MNTKEGVCNASQLSVKKIILSIFFLLVLCRTAGAQDSQKATLTAADAGTCSATSTACLVINIPSGSGGATFNIGANASANTVQFEASADYGATWVALSVTPSSSTTTVTSTTSTGAWQANVAGYTKLRMRCSTFVGGTTTTYINLSTASARSNGGGGSVTHTAGNLTAFHLMLGNGLADSTVDSACVTNGTGALSGCTSLSAGSGASAAGATATGGFACVEGPATGWTPTAAQDYIRCDSVTHSLVASQNGVAESPLGSPVFPLLGSNGTVGAPSYSWSAHATSGFYWNANNGPMLSTLGVDTLAISAGGPTIPNTLVYGFSSNLSGGTSPNLAISEDAGQGILDVGTGAQGSAAAFIRTGNTVVLTSNFTTASATLVTITGLSWTFPATNHNYAWNCRLSYSQATAAAADAFGVQAATTAPINLMAWMNVSTGLAVTGVDATLPLLSTTTATNIGTFTPSAAGAIGTIADIFTAELGGLLEQGAGATTLNIMVLTGNVSDSITIYRGSSCSLIP